jgi:predicted AlkP superfamily pyrophosphatase or phosphodiesterase
MLPPKPATFGRLSAVFAASLEAVLGRPNELKFRPAKRVITVLVDGLGWQNLKGAGGHAVFLNQAAATSKPIACAFPSTTATSITSFATGTWAGEHGMVGYKVLNPQTGNPFNLLNGWDASTKATDWQLSETVAARAIEAGIAAYVIGPPAYESSDFTAATMPGAKYIAAKAIEDRFSEAKRLLASGGDRFICYLYVPELDQTAHSAGCGSYKWLEKLEELDAAAQGLSEALRKDDAMILTADHGVIDVPAHSQILLDELDVDWSGVTDISGDPRVNFIYCKAGLSIDALKTEIANGIGQTGVVATRSEVISAGWYGPKSQIPPQVLDRLPDLFLIAVKNVAYYHRGYAPAQSLKMIGQHGGMSATELMVPLLRWGSV